MTVSSGMFAVPSMKEAKLPPLPSRSHLFSFGEERMEEGLEKSPEEQMLRSYYQTEEKGWVRPQEYLR
jgi:hypothetical protein